MADAAGEMIMRCFHARTNAHVLHLRTRSFAEHKALQEFYEGLVPLVDNLAESYQGLYGLIEDYPVDYAPAENGLQMLSDLVDWIEQNRDDVSEESFCQNVIDEIVALVRATQYKLQFLQ